MTAPSNDSTPSNSGTPMERELLVVSVSAYSVAAIVSYCSAVFGFIRGLMIAHDRLKLYIDADRLPRLTSSYIVKEVLWTGSWVMAIFLVYGFVAGLLLAGLYNAVGQTTGGLRLRVREVTLGPSKPPRLHVWARRLGRLWGRKR